MKIEFTPLGFIESCFREKFGTPRQGNVAPSSWARLTLGGQLNPTDLLQGLEGFSHVWLLWVFHQNSNKATKAKVRPPRLDGVTVGALATRSPHRPNPIGLSLVKLEKIVENTLFFSGIDLVDGTPVLDIKPYIPDYDSVENPRVGWMAQAPEPDVPVEFAPELNLAEGLKNIIRECIVKDPRPPAYKKRDGVTGYPGFLYAIAIGEHDVKFVFADNKFVVMQVDPYLPNHQ